MEQTHNRRSSDVQINQLATKFDELNSEVQKLKNDFNDHAQNEATKIELLNASLVSIQVKLDQLLIEIKEPLESYKTAKYGVSFLKFIAETAKWAVPLIVGSFIGYSALDAMHTKIDTQKPKQEQNEVTK